MDRFGQILYDLGQEIGIMLHPDENRLCQIHFEEKLSIQLEYDEAKLRLSIASFLCEVPPGKYREQLLKEALKSNGESSRIGTLAYCQQNNQLTLFAYAYPPQQRSDQLLILLERFIEKGLSWKNGVETGKPLPTSMPPSSTRGIFGLLQ